MDYSTHPNSITVMQAAGLLMNAGRVLICGHVNPDGDCIGSMAALALAVRSLGKSAHIAVVSSLPLKYRFFDELFPLPAGHTAHNADLVVVIDTPALARLDIPADSLPSGVPVLCIDHHPVTPSDFDFVLEDRREAAAGCILYDVLRAMPVTITPAIASGLYTAIITDTGRFTNQNTSPRVFELALELVRAGADPVDLAAHIYQSATVAQMRLLGAVLETLELVNGGRGAIMYLSDSMRCACGGEEADTENFVNYARAIHGVEAAALLTEEPGGTAVKISLRSKLSACDVSVFAAEFGGGGHPGASGATVAVSLTTFLPEFKSRFEKFVHVST